MSCGCGGIPPSVSIRIEAARLALNAKPDQFDSLAPDVLAFITEGTDLAALDTPATPVAIGDSPEAVTSRNALINAPLQRVGALDRAVVSRLVVAGMHALGALVQADSSHLQEAGLTLQQAAQLALDLRRYGLHLGMSHEQVRDWIVGQAA